MFNKIENKGKFFQEMEYSFGHLKRSWLIIRLLLLSLVYSSLAIAVSYSAEYLLYLHPCRLCLYQRYGYIAWFVVICILALYSWLMLFPNSVRDNPGEIYNHHRNFDKEEGDNITNEEKRINLSIAENCFYSYDSNSFSHRIIVLLVLIFPAAEMLLALFHMGVEYKIWTFSSSCISNLAQAESYADFQRLLAAADNVMCDVQSSILGVPMTLLNFLYSASFLLLVLWRRKSI